MDCHASMGAPAIATGVHNDPREPCVEAIEVPQAWKLAPRSNECLLDHVPGIGFRAEDRQRQPKQPTTVPVDEGSEGQLVPAARSLDERHDLTRDVARCGCERWHAMIIGDHGTVSRGLGTRDERCHFVHEVRTRIVAIFDAITTYDDDRSRG